MNAVGERRLRLSVCIPTHDGRAATLAEALTSIVDQVTPQLEGVVEICVSDNGSRDGTQALVDEHVARRPGLVTYARFEENRGFTANLLQVVGLARGEFVWFLGSDDAVVPGGLGRVLDLLERHPDATGATLHPILYDVAGERDVPSLWPPPLPSGRDREQRWTRLEDAAVQCGLLMGILTAQVVRRETWVGVAAELGTELQRTPRFPHLAIIYRMLVQHPVWLWEPERVFLLRADTENSLIDELAGDLTQYHLETTRESVQIWREVFGPGTIERRLRRRCLQALFNPLALASYRVHPQHSVSDDLHLLFACTRWFGRFPEFWLLTVPAFLVPMPLLRFVQAVVRRRKSR